MGKIRSILYGYTMTDCKIIVSPEEQEIVLEIFQKYKEGGSYKTISQDLTQRKIPYLPEKTEWNKNMVARILQNEDYKGTEKFPPLISEQEWQATKEKMKPYNRSLHPDIKALKPKMKCHICGKPLERLVLASGRIRWKCVDDYTHVDLDFSDDSFLDQLTKIWTRHCDGAEKTAKKVEISEEILKLEAKLKAVKIGGEINTSDFMATTMQIAKMKYDICPTHNIAFESTRLSFENIVTISVSSSKIQNVLLKDGELIEMG